MEDVEVPNPACEGWMARDAHRKGREAGNLGAFRSPRFPAGTPERDEWEAGWKDLDDALKVREKDPNWESLSCISIPPRRRYLCAVCGTVYETMSHCQSLERAMSTPLMDL